MSAPQLPNLLNNLRDSKSSRQGRSRRHDSLKTQSEEEIVQGTDDDAAGSRLSAVETGHLHDPFARTFAASKGTVRRMPIINRGTYVRTTAIDLLVQRFLDRHRSEATQIVSLGAGTDTRFFRLLQRSPSLVERLHYHEIDFPVTTSKKIKAIESAPLILSLLQSGVNGMSRTTTAERALEISADKTSLKSQSYSIHAFDLRDMASSTPPQLLNLSSTSATLILSECCLTYLPPSISHAILAQLSSNYLPHPTPLEVILYEPLHPHDAFGRTMVANLSTRGITMPGIEACPTLDAHKERLRDVGFEDLREGWEIREIWDQWISPEDKERLRRLEMVDEEEEWTLLAGHYGIIRALRTGERRANEQRSHE